MHASAYPAACCGVSERIKMVTLHLEESPGIFKKTLKIHIRDFFGTVAGVFFLSCILSVIWPSPAMALPFFSRQIGRNCTFCHTLIPKLNEKGRIFRSNGYRFPGEGEWKEVSAMETVPVSLELEAEGMYDRVKNSSWKESSNLKLDETDLTAGGAVGRSGRVSALASVLGVEKTPGPGVNVRIQKGFVQVNDIIGPQGEGALNVRAGRWDVGLPFFNTIGTVITNRLLADSVLNVLTPQQNAVEVNGSIVADEDSPYPTQRYSVGATSEDVLSGNKLKGYYAAYSATFREVLNIGAIYRGGQERAGVADTHFDRWGVAAEGAAGPFILTLGYFAKEQRGTPGLENYVVESIYMPIARVSFAARYDVVKANGLKETKAGSLMARYNILSNVFTQLELRALSDRDHIKGANGEEERMRFILTAVF